IAWTRMKRVCLLSLGLAMTGGGQGLAADINTVSFATLAESSSATAAGPASDSPFKDETVAAPTKGVPFEPSSAECGSPSCASGIACGNDNFVGAPGRVWFRGEYLHWWTNGAHLPPMVSTVDQNGNPETLFGGGDIGKGNHDGYRIDFGLWLDHAHCWGMEADYFDVSGKPNNYDTGVTQGNANGVAYPIVRFVSDPGNPGFLTPDYVGVVSPTNPFIGRETVCTNDYFQSAGMWLRRQLLAREYSTSDGDVNWTDPSARTFRLDAIGGYRFARLIDTVNEQDDDYNISNLNEYSFVNDYRAVNNFSGAELGLNAVYTRGRWSLDVVCKAAIGVNNQYVRLYNQQTVDESNSLGVPTALILNNPAPLQEFSRNRFSAIPELMVTAGYQLTDHLKFTVGYDLLYWSAIVRAADQIAVDPTNGYPYGNVVSTPLTNPLPAFAWNESYFFAQGLRLGAELRF
ncbi:MAG: BBP7 family outer membrane beta-barrel protein, partial [Thermoguttaceae bacterium]